MNTTNDSSADMLTQRAVVTMWWPLAASWLMMGLELPLVNAVVARLPDERTHLAALGSLVFPLCMLIEAPIIMLLSASTALCKDRASYRHLGNFMLLASGLLTLLHALVAFTPLFDVLALDVFDMEPQLVEPGRIGMAIMLPWTFAIAYRRYQQGVLIRFGRSRVVGVGTLVRLCSVAAVAIAGGWYGGFSGSVVGTVAIAAGVIAEALFAGWYVRPVVAERLPETFNATPWVWREFGRFYTPLAMFAIVGMVAQPVAAAAIGRMPREVASLAAWPAVNNLVFLLRSLGFAASEVVVATLGRPGARAVLSTFAWRLGIVTSGGLALIALTPLAGLWFGALQGLDGELVQLGVAALVFALPSPLLQARMSFLTGSLVHARRTSGVGEAVVVFIATSSLCLLFGVQFVPWPGVQQAPVALTIGALAQSLWLYRRTAQVERAVLAAPQALT